MIVECPGCKNRYDVTGRPPGTRARCRCGTMFELPHPTEQARTLSCPSCGGNVAPGDSACSFCHAALLVKACPRCFARIFHGAKHCSMCGAKVEVAAVANEDGSARRLSCPRCDSELFGRLAGDVLLDECSSCHGIWIDSEALERLIRAREEETITDVIGRPKTREQAAAGASPSPEISSERFYVQCPECSTVMTRKVFADVSGVIVDQCKNHGTWFDAGELPQVIAFIEEGGLGKARQRQMQRLEDERRRLKTGARASLGEFEMQSRSGRSVFLGDTHFERESPIMAALSALARALFH